MARLTKEQRRQLDDEGYVLLKNVLSGQEVAKVRERLEELWQEEGEEAGAENYIEEGARRLANLADKGQLFRAIYAHPLVLAGVVAIMGADVHLSMLNARDVPPGHDPQMPMHRDTDSNRPRDARGYHSATAIWMLDPFYEKNGATRLLPGTHRSEGPLEELRERPEPVVVEGSPGDVLLFNGHCWHTGGANRTEAKRRAILAHYLRADIPLRPERRQHLSAASAERLTPQERELLALAD